jgi:photosystem II stability/assembly factor-like uncharacterized protein
MVGCGLCVLLVLSVLAKHALLDRRPIASKAATAVTPNVAANEGVEAPDMARIVPPKQDEPMVSRRLSGRIPVIARAVSGEEEKRDEKVEAKNPQAFHSGFIEARKTVEMPIVSPSLEGPRNVGPSNSSGKANVPTAKPQYSKKVAMLDEKEESEEEGSTKKPRPFHPDSINGREAFESLPVNPAFEEWRNVGPSNFAGKAYAVAVDPQDSNNVYAAYEVGGLWGTHDGGQSWIPMFNGFRNIAFSSVRTHPNVPGMVAAGLIAYGGGYFTSYNKNVGIVLSKDGGTTWKNIGPSIDPTASVWEVGFGDKTGQIIYAPTDKGLYKTTNQGESWTEILAYSSATGVAPVFFNARPSFAVDPVNPDILLLVTATEGLMRSTDAGKTWKEVDTWVQPTGQQNSTILTWSKANPQNVYAEAYTGGLSSTLTMYTSTDEGATWTAGAVTSEFQQGMYDMAIAADPFNPDHVIIHNTSLQYSTDGLNTLQDGNAPGPDCLAVTFDPSHPNVVYDGGDDGVFKSTDGGNTWARFDTGVLSNKSVGGSNYAVATDGTIYTNPADYSGQADIPGYGWIKRSDGYEYNRYYVNPHDPTQLYEMGGSGFFRSPNATTAEANIDPAPSEPASYNYLGVEFDPVSATTLYLGKGNLYKTTNEGNSWTEIAPSSTFGSQPVYLVKVAPSNTQHIYVDSAANQIYSTTDGGNSWTSGPSLAGIGMMAVSPADENTLYIAAGNGMYKSTDGGLTATQLPGFPSVSASWVTVDPKKPNRVYAALTNSGTLVSEDSGDTWQRLGTLLPLVQVDWMSVMGGNLYAGTGASVWEMSLTGQPPCSQVTVNPPSLTAPSTAGTYPFDVSIPANCSWEARSNASWATVQTYGVNTGPAIPQVELADNTGTNSPARTTTVAISGQPISVTQLGGLDPVQDGSLVTLSNSSGCVTVYSDEVTLEMQTCTAGNPNQEFSLQLISGLQYRLINSVYGQQCINVYNDAIQTGSQVAEYACAAAPATNEIFTVQPQANGSWTLIGNDSRLCLSVGSGGAVQNTCSASNASELFTIAQVPPGFSLSSSASTVGIIQGAAGGTSTITVSDVGGFTGNVSLAVSGLPTGVAASFSPNPATGTSTLTLTAASTATLGVATLTVTGTSGSITSSTPLTLTVNSVASTLIQFVQVNANDTSTATAAASSVTVPYSAAQVAGDLNIVVVGWEDTAAVVSSVTDSNGNKYKLAVGPTLSQVMPGTQSIYYASDVSPASAGANTVTVTFNTAASYPDVRIVEYHGVSTLDAVATTAGNSANMDSGPATTTAAPELLFGANNMENWTNNPGVGYTQRIQSDWGNIVEDEVVSVVGAYDATALESPAGGWIMQLATFK